jgi:FkbM family methyltransferase
LTRIFGDRVWPVLSGPLRGLKLRFNSLIQGRVYFKAYERDKQLAFDKFLKRGDIFFDIGANIGLHSYYVSQHYPDVRIFSFEPLKENANYIRETLTINSITNINVIEKAVSAASGEAFFDPSANNSTGTLSDEIMKVKVSTISLDDFINQSGLFPDVIKIDVEGAESRVLEGVRVFLNKRRPVFVIELHSPEQDIKVADFLKEFNYTIFRLKSERRSDFLVEVSNTASPWPDPEGVWGGIVAVCYKN